MIKGCGVRACASLLREGRSRNGFASSLQMNCVANSRSGFGHAVISLLRRPARPCAAWHGEDFCLAGEKHLAAFGFAAGEELL